MTLAHSAPSGSMDDTDTSRLILVMGAGLRKKYGSNAFYPVEAVYAEAKVLEIDKSKSPIYLAVFLTSCDFLNECPGLGVEFYRSVRLLNGVTGSASTRGDSPIRRLMCAMAKGLLVPLGLVVVVAISLFVWVLVAFGGGAVALVVVLFVLCLLLLFWRWRIK